MSCALLRSSNCLRSSSHATFGTLSRFRNCFCAPNFSVGHDRSPSLDLSSSQLSSDSSGSSWYHTSRFRDSEAEQHLKADCDPHAFLSWHDSLKLIYVAWRAPEWRWHAQPLFDAECASHDPNSGHYAFVYDQNWPAGFHCPLNQLVTPRSDKEITITTIS